MAKFVRHIFICTNQRPAGSLRGSCDPEGTARLHSQFKKELAARGLKGEVRANRAGCLDQCEHGTVVVVYPEAVWYRGVTADDVTEIVDAHLVRGEPVERLVMAEGCINTPSCGHKASRETQ